MSEKLADIAAMLETHGAVLHGDGQRLITRIAPLKSADAQSISFLSNPAMAAELQTTQAACVLVSPAMQEAALQRGAASTIGSNGQTPRRDWAAQYKRHAARQLLA